MRHGIAGVGAFGKAVLPHHLNTVLLHILACPVANAVTSVDQLQLTVVYLLG